MLQCGAIQSFSGALLTLGHWSLHKAQALGEILHTLPATAVGISCTPTAYPVAWRDVWTRRKCGAWTSCGAALKVLAARAPNQWGRDSGECQIPFGAEKGGVGASLHAMRATGDGRVMHSSRSMHFCVLRRGEGVFLGTTIDPSSSRSEPYNIDSASPISSSPRPSIHICSNVGPSSTRSALFHTVCL